MNATASDRTRAWVLHPDIKTDLNRRDPARALEEAVSLARALPDLEVVGELVVPLPKPQPGTLFGSGKVEELGQATTILHADFDERSDLPDLCVLDRSIAGIVFVRNLGNRSFETGVTMSPLVGGMNSADLNGDGHQDLVFAYRVRFGDGLGSFEESQSYLGIPNGTIDKVFFEDVDGDSTPDWIGTSGGDPYARFHVAPRDNAGNFPRIFEFAGEFRGSGPSTVADFDRDGLADVAMSTPEGVRIHFNRTNRAVRCRAGAVDGAAYRPPVDVLRVNDSTGESTTRELAVDSLEPMRVALETAPVPAVGNRYFVAVWSKRPAQGDVRVLPVSIGFGCFAPLRNDPRYVQPLYVANTLAPNHPLLDPPGAEATGDVLPGVVLDLPSGVLLPGQTLTVQGIVGDGRSRSPKRVSLTNAVVVGVE